jgi:hypothetical protein
MDAKRVDLSEAVSLEGDPVRKKALAIAALLQGVIQLSDNVTENRSPLDMQGRLLALHNSIQKNRPRMVALLNEFIDAANSGKES